MARKPSKTIVQPDQHELFAQVRARFADIGAIGTLSLLLTVTVTVSILTTLFSTDEDFWFRPALMSVRWPLLGLVFLVVSTEFVRSMGWIERKDVFATFHFGAILGVLGVLAFLLWQSGVIQEIRAIERASEAAKIEAARTVEAECQRQRTEEIDRTTKRRGDMRALLQRCLEDFEKDKTIFTEDTAEQRCKGRQAALNAAERDFKAANARTCVLTGK